VHDILAVVLVIAGGIAAMTIVFNVAMVLVANILGVSIVKVQFGFGPVFRLFKAGKTSVYFSPLLLNGFVKYDRPLWGSADALPWLKSVLLGLSGPAAAVAVAAIPLGWRAVEEMLMTWPQMWQVILQAPRPVDIVPALAPTIKDAGFAAAGAIVLVKLAAVNLLPLPFLVGGTTLIATFEALTRKRISERVMQPLLMTSLAAAIGYLLVLVVLIAL
jgi:hypothetical protein